MAPTTTMQKSTPTQKSASSYIPPSLRATKPAPYTSAKKKEPKKEFAVDNTAFPTLGDTIKKSGTPMSFSSAAAKKVEAPKIVQVDVLPGWVHIRRNAGKIEYKYGKPILRNDEEDRAEAIRSRIILKNRIAREEYDRERDIELLGDLSQFYGQPTLAELYEIEYICQEESSSESSDYSDIE